MGFDEADAGKWRGRQHVTLRHNGQIDARKVGAHAADRRNQQEQRMGAQDQPQVLHAQGLGGWG